MSKTLINLKKELIINDIIYTINVIYTNNVNTYFTKETKNDENVYTLKLSKNSSFEDNIDFIRKTLMKRKFQKLNKIYFSYENNYFTILDKKIHYSIYNNILTFTFKDCLYEYKLKQITEYNVKNCIDKFKIMQLSNILAFLIPYYTKKMNVTNKYKSFKIIKNIKSYWAKNSVNHGLLKFNMDLISFELKCIESVIVHELAHFYEANHSKEFKKIVYEYFPQYNIWNKKLQQR
ncbi:YgjP-like metallopeptidase domain-containing protein [Mycoplasma phocoenae]|uniref:M48 family metallopeptidase n=1 Tax=Mycoplasma phocoenae TaxID=754517 RepID=A0A858U1Z7_9MOLU|nr:YgjP-like metallopeptidase domain-containing protein [Mycoplasma phocoenae]QJG67164.1 M48 family metallopeptidase [Mycoplasma phocoenae]